MIANKAKKKKQMTASFFIPKIDFIFDCPQRKELRCRAPNERR